MLLTKSLRVFVPLPTVMVVVLPPATMLKLPAGRAVKLLLTGAEYQEPVWARLFTVTEWVPATAPEVAVPLTMLESEDDSDSEFIVPRGSFKVLRSFSRPETAVLSEVRSVVWEDRVA